MTERSRPGAWGLLAVVLAAVALRFWGIEPVRVRTSSMAPTLLAGDVVLVWRPGTAQAGDVVLMEEPSSEGLRHVKRMVAGQGQVVELSQGQLYVDGQRLGEADPTGGVVRWLDRDCGVHESQPVLESVGSRQWSILPGGEHGRETIPGDHVWLLGDHRGASSDSRHWGPVERTWLRGRVLGVIWSRAPCGELRLNRIGPLAQVSGGHGDQPSG